MTREELEHVIRASGDITDQYEFVIVGSQSILGAVPRPEDVFTVSMEADIYPLQAPELADKIDGAIGEGSQFHETYGYYAQGVGPETACLPAGWMQRVHRIQNRNTQDRIGYCLDVLDLFLAKAVAAHGRGCFRGERLVQTAINEASSMDDIEAIDIPAMFASAYQDAYAEVMTPEQAAE